MIKKLYVGGLPYQTNEDELKEAFAAAGEVESVLIVKDKFSGKSKGFGFVEMKTEAGAGAAKTMWDGKQMGGRILKVNDARPMTEKPPKRTGRNNIGDEEF